MNSSREESEKAGHQIGEDICNTSTNKGLYPEYIKKSYKSVQIKSVNPVKNQQKA